MLSFSSKLKKINFDYVVEAYKLQVKGLIDAGADILIIETVFDLLMAKTVLQAIEFERKKRKIKIPVIISATINKNGKIFLLFFIQMPKYQTNLKDTIKQPKKWLWK